jgi:hypothetical protein
MPAAEPSPRYEMVNIRPGYLVVEHEVFSRRMRSYFTSEPVPPIEEYREGPDIWKFSGVVQSFHFDIRDTMGGEVTGFDDLLGLVPHTACPEDSDLYRLGEIAREQRVWIYVAVPLQPGEGPGLGRWAEKLKVLNRYFGERLATPNKKILILPDYFGVHEQFDHGMVMADTGLTAMEG